MKALESRMSPPTTEESITLDEAARARLAQLADQLIPGGHGLPSASEIGVHAKWIDRALAARPDLAAPLHAALARSEEPDVALERLREDDRGTFESFGYLVAGAYLMHPRVRKRLGYPSNVPKPKPAYPDEADMYLADGILDAVIERGPIFRPAP
jgi:hypothetical protein